MTNWLMRWVASAVALAIVAHIPGLGISYDNSLGVLIEATFVIGLVNSLIRPIVMLLALPLNCLTFGVAGCVVNAVLFWFTVLIVPGFHVGTVVGAFMGPVLMGLISGLLSAFLVDTKRRK